MVKSNFFLYRGQTKLLMIKIDGKWCLVQYCWCF